MYPVEKLVTCVAFNEMPRSKKIVYSEKGLNQHGVSKYVFICGNIVIL